ncbi:hypothetical protein IMCC14465_11090 [alpha proteobacterium IMCC14465]|uniref:Uncharacterized protein n=1 Tax=alpha proteobacterium IMCC14465 TaxID=1220535 RepID=J9DGQ8_9PROT|nr:hypothetical protein IMCC14465_11090 [alpha proteobacterium IMCC14465]
MSSSQRKELQEETDGLSHLSSDAQSLLADLATDKATRKYVTLPANNGVAEEADIHSDEHHELNAMVFDAFTPPEPEETVDETQNASAMVFEDAELSGALPVELDIPDRGGDRLLSLMTDVETDYADTATAAGEAGDLSTLVRDMQDTHPDFAVSDEDEAVSDDDGLATVSHLEQLKRRFAAGLAKLRGGQAQDISDADAPIIVRKIFEAETSASPIPKTAILAFVLLLVAALPPILNFTYIQPTISENNRKADDITIFQGQILKNNKRSNDLLSQIKLLEKRSANIAGTLVDRERFDFLLQRFLAAFERFGVEIISITNDVDAESKFIVGNNLPVLVNTVTVELESRFEVYRSIREIFVKEVKSVAIIEENLTAKPGSNLLRVRLKMAVAYNGKE